MASRSTLRSSSSRGGRWAVTGWLVLVFILGQRAALCADDPCGCEADLRKKLTDSDTEWRTCIETAKTKANMDYDSCEESEKNQRDKADEKYQLTRENILAELKMESALCSALSDPARTICLDNAQRKAETALEMALNDYLTQLDTIAAARRSCDLDVLLAFREDCQDCDAAAANREKNAGDAHKQCVDACVII